MVTARLAWVTSAISLIVMLFAIGCETVGNSPQHDVPNVPESSEETLQRLASIVGNDMVPRLQAAILDLSDEELITVYQYLTERYGARPYRYFSNYLIAEQYDEIMENRRLQEEAEREADRLAAERAEAERGAERAEAEREAQRLAAERAAATREAERIAGEQRSLQLYNTTIALADWESRATYLDSLSEEGIWSMYDYPIEAGVGRDSAEEVVHRISSHIELLYHGLHDPDGFRVYRVVMVETTSDAERVELIKELTENARHLLARFARTVTRYQSPREQVLRLIATAATELTEERRLAAEEAERQGEEERRLVAEEEARRREEEQRLVAQEEERRRESQMRALGTFSYGSIPFGEPLSDVLGAVENAYVHYEDYGARISQVFFYRDVDVFFDGGVYAIMSTVGYLNKALVDQYNIRSDYWDDISVMSLYFLRNSDSEEEPRLMMVYKQFEHVAGGYADVLASFQASLSRIIGEDPRFAGRTAHENPAIGAVRADMTVWEDDNVRVLFLMSMNPFSAIPGDIEFVYIHKPSWNLYLQLIEQLEREQQEQTEADIEGAAGSF